MWAYPAQKLRRYISQVIFYSLLAPLSCLVAPRSTHQVFWQNPNPTSQNAPSDRTDVGGQQVRLRLLDKIGGYRSGTKENIRLQVLHSVRLGELTIVEEGAEAIGRATIIPPRTHVSGKISLEAVSALGTTGVQIPLFGVETSTGAGCVEDHAFWCIWSDGGPASMEPGLEFEATVAQGFTLPIKALLAYEDQKFQHIQTAIAHCKVRLALWVYQPSASKIKHPKVFLDGIELGPIPPGTVRSLVPKAGSHVISVMQSSLTVDFEECTPYYIRLFQGENGQNATIEIQSIRPDVGQDAVRDLLEIQNAH